MLTDEQIIAIADSAHDKWNSEADRDNQWDSLGHDEIFVLIARAIESAVRAELMRGEFICHKCGIRQDAPKPDVAPF
jgi:hypothetical protein